MVLQPDMNGGGISAAACKENFLCYMFLCQPPAEVEVINSKEVLPMVEKIAMTIEEAAEYTGIGRNTLRLLVSERKLPVLLIGRKHIVRTGALIEFLKINQGVDLRDIDNVKSVS